ncbi:MAG: pantetheine-phosphate adenylyltransferase [Thermoplasmata archaeon]|nr:pantetheine-phosphate adenylyltransferase [Thermoplasmata archaeon]
MPVQLAVVGGTFDRLHAGHIALLEAAFARAQVVAIGVTTDRFLARHPKPLAARITRYATRRRHLVSYLRAHYPRSRWRIVPLNDGWGRSVEPGPELLVASEDTRAGALSVNRERRRRRLAPLQLYLVPLRRGQDGSAISSRRIRAGWIDDHGRRLRALRVVYRGPDRWRGAVRQGVVAAFPGLSVRWGVVGSPADFTLRFQGGTHDRSISLVRPPRPNRARRLRPTAGVAEVARVVSQLLR